MTPKQYLSAFLKSAFAIGVFILSFLSLVSAQDPEVQLHEFASGFTRPTDIASAGDGQLYVAEIGGTIRIVDTSGNVSALPFLNIRSQVAHPEWSGIMGLAFHPDYLANGYFFVKFLRADTSIVVSRFQRDPSNANYANPASERVFFTLPNYSGHVGGTIAFGPDGYLYIPLGDGERGRRGEQGDTNQIAQNLQSFRGKILRINVDQGDPYSIPATNPFQSPGNGYPDELWAIGVRNPWGLSFDSEMGDLWFGDNGQDGWEEVNYLAYPFENMPNFGWSCFEGSHAYNSCSGSGSFINPLYEYPGYLHNGNQSASVMGGYVYRGQKYPILYGCYFFADYSNGSVMSLKRQGSSVSPVITHGTIPNPIGFGQDDAGELYVATFYEGKVYQIRGNLIESVQSGSWENPATWSCYCVPGISHDVVINSGHTVQLHSAGASVNSLRLHGGSLDLNKGLLLSADN